MTNRLFRNKYMVVNSLRARICEFKREMNRLVRGHNMFSSQLTVEIFVGGEAACGNQLIINGAERQCEIREGLAKGGGIQNDGIDNKGIFGMRMIAYHQVVGAYFLAIDKFGQDAA